jgi:hypothetical protein
MPWDFGVSPSSPLNLSDRLLEEDIQKDPLLYGRPSVYEQYREPSGMPQLEGIDPAIMEANPLARPPRPIKYMPVEEQIIWNKMQSETLKNQAGLQSQLNQNRAAALARKIELDREVQSSVIFDAWDQVDPTRDDYLEQKGKLFRANPVGAMSNEVRNAIGVKDVIWQNRKELNDEDRKRKADLEDALAKNRLSESFKQAAELNDPALIERISKLSAEDPALALAEVQNAKRESYKRNLIAEMRDLGVSDQEMSSKYLHPETGDFLYDAARSRVEIEREKRKSATADESKLIDYVLKLEKNKAEGQSATAKIEGKTWSDADEAMLQRYRAKLENIPYAEVPTSATPNVPTKGISGVAPPSEPTFRTAPTLSPTGVPQRVPVTQQKSVSGVTQSKEAKKDELGDQKRLGGVLYEYQEKVKGKPRWYPIGQ